MNFASIKKAIAGITALIVLASTVSFSSVSADQVIEPLEVQEVRGTGGSNPLVVAKLRAEGLERQKKIEAERLKIAADRWESQNFPPLTISPKNTFGSRYDTQVLPEYIPDFKTIGDVKAEQSSIVSQDKLQEKEEELMLVVASSDFTTQFSDIENSTQNQSIVLLDALNIISGRENTQFKPQEKITRKEVIKISTLISGLVVAPRKSSSVSDIDVSDWSVPYVESARENGVINLNSDNNLEGDLAVTAGEAFAIYLLSANVCIDLDKAVFAQYSDFKTNFSADIVITNYVTDLLESDELTRADFAKISTDMLTALSSISDYAPTEQLIGSQYSASQSSKEESALLLNELLDVLLK